MNVLQINNLHKEYGRITAVNKLNLSINTGSVFGLLGPNGSGKTTTLGMILGVTNPSAGDFYWFGDEQAHHARKRIGSILEKPNFYPTFTGYKNLELACLIKDVPKNRIPEVIDQVGLYGRDKDPFKTYSLGMKQRLAIASALLANPDVLILDEPTNGLDPKGISEIRQLIIDIALSGKTIILASHLLDEVQKVCSEFAILKQGNLIHTGKVDDGFGDELIVELATENNGHLDEALRKYPFYISGKRLKDKIEIKCKSETEVVHLNKYLIEEGIYLTHLVVVKKSLEQQFMEILAENA